MKFGRPGKMWLPNPLIPGVLLMASLSAQTPMYRALCFKNVGQLSRLPLRKGGVV